MMNLDDEIPDKTYLHSLKEFPYKFVTIRFKAVWTIFSDAELPIAYFSDRLKAQRFVDLMRKSGYIREI